MSPTWPAIPYPAWRDTAATLQLWTQVVGKVRVALAPWVNHGWHVTLHVTARGLGTGPMPVDGEYLELEFDFVRHRLDARTSAGAEGGFALEPMAVADFHARAMDLLAEVGTPVRINPRPSEIADAIPFPEDRVHASYDADAAHRFWRALVQADRVFRLFRTGFLGKVSPVHFFWGSFDLAVTRFSGRTAPAHPGGIPGLPDAITREAYSHEEASAGFWPGSDALPEPAFYAYAYPEPPGYRDRPVPPPARFDPALGEFLLPYEAVRTAPDPDRLLLDFLQATYDAAADCGGWDRAALDCPIGQPKVVRPI